jgi:cytosine/uracil/thiamine/allantoin permease
MDWKQAVATVFLGNSIVLLPMLLNSQPGVGAINAFALIEGHPQGSFPLLNQRCV